jgi:hypothetical protein
MKNENKDILLKELCARLPYGVVCHTSVGDYKLLGIDIYKNEVHLDSPVYDEGNGYFDLEYEEVKPYLRQMSSMTQDEIEKYRQLCETDDGDFTGEPLYFNTCESFDYLNSIHVDYRNFIERGLALEAPKNMYK